MAMTAQRIADLKVIKEVMGTAGYENPLFIMVMDMTLATIDLVIADGEGGTHISQSYVSDNYGDRILEAKAIYDAGMTEEEKDEFKASVVTMIGECQLRGIKMTLPEIYRYFVGF